MKTAKQRPLTMYGIHIMKTTMLPGRQLNANACPKMSLFFINMDGISQWGQKSFYSPAKITCLYLQVRGRQLGKLLLATLTLLARRQGCYKVTLNCADPMVKFYNGFGFRCEEGDANFMALRL